MKQVTFVTGNGWRHEEARRLLSGINVVWARLNLAKPSGVRTLREVATGRVRDAFRQLGTPVFIENTGLYLREHDDAPGTGFKKLLLELGEAEFARRFGGSTGVTKLVVAYTADGDDVRLFEGQSEGRLLTSPRGEGGYGWDRLWVPDGYEHTLAELAHSKFLVNMRHLPFVELADLLRGDGLDGIFEAHVTVAPCDEAAFSRTCEALGVKSLFIELPRGAEPVQPMTGSVHHARFVEVQREVHELAVGLLQAGFKVTRTKIEAVGRHRDIPTTDAQAAMIPPSRYFEHHLRVFAPDGVDIDAVTEPLRALNAYLSRNTRRANERYVTLRTPHVGQDTADARFMQVEDVVRAHGLVIRSRVREYTVYDSAPEVDRGWFG